MTDLPVKYRPETDVNCPQTGRNWTLKRREIEAKCTQETVSAR